MDKCVSAFIFPIESLSGEGLGQLPVASVYLRVWCEQSYVDGTQKY